MSTLKQFSFAAGELAPSLYARTDTNKYQIGLKRMRNFILLKHGGAASRPGTQFVCEVAYSEDPVRLIEFIFNDAQTYVLEFGDLYMRVIKDGLQLTETAKNITGITNANPAVVTSNAHGYSNGDEVYITGISGAIADDLNNRNFKVAGVTANTYQLQYMDGTNVNSTSFGSYTSGGTCERVYEIDTPYTTADVGDLNFVQSADVITIVHPSYSPRELSRLGDTSWTISAITFNPSISQPTGLSATAAVAGAVEYNFKVTAVNEETGEESLPALGPNKTITGATKANPCVITSAGHGLANGDEVYIKNVVGMTELNNRTFIVSGVAANTFQLDGENSTGYTTYSSGGVANKTFVTLTSAAISTTNYIDVNWTQVSEARLYHIYQELNGVFGYIGSAEGGTFRAIGASPDIADTPPNSRNPFFGADNYPSTVGYFQQRLGFASTNDNPETTYFSKSGQFKNFTVSAPIQDDDAVTFTIVGRKVNRIKHMVDIGNLTMLTEGGIHIIQGDAAGVLKPADVNPKQLSYHGSGDLKPVIVGNNIVYVQTRGSYVRAFSLDDIKGSENIDLTIFSTHLFEGKTISDWSYQEVPNSVIWAAMSDGGVVALTYVRDQELIGWHRHDFDGTVENVCCVPEGDEDAVYFVIKRSIGGVYKRYIERMTTRTINDIVDYVGLDSSLSYDGRNTGSRTMTLSGSGWTYVDSLTLTASSAYFSASDVGNSIFIDTDDGDIIRCSIISYTSTTQVTVRPHKTVPASLQSVATTSWARAVDEIQGLWHLEGKQVSIFADGFVVANPNNDSYEAVTVTNGTITLDHTYSVIHVGLPITADLETLDVDTTNGETIVDKKKIVQKVTLYCEKSRGIWIGGSVPSDDTVDPLEDLNELKIRNEEGYEDPIELATGPIEVTIKPEWNSNGRVFVRQVDPIPLTVLAIAPAGMFPFRGGGN